MSNFMKKITITLDDRTARRVRSRAAKRRMSVSAYVGEALLKDLIEDESYLAAYRAWRAEKPFPLQGPPQPFPKREELYDRPVFRRA